MSSLVKLPSKQPWPYYGTLHLELKFFNHGKSTIKNTAITKTTIKGMDNFTVQIPVFV